MSFTVERNATVEFNGQFFDLSDGSGLEGDCYDYGSHTWGEDKYSGRIDMQQGYHQCTHCFRIEPL